MQNIWDTILNGLSDLNSSIGFVGSVITIFDHFNNQNGDHLQETLHIIRDKSQKAYDLYCEYRRYRPDELGVPDKEKILGYWETCMQRNILPDVSNMVSSGIATQKESEIMLPYLMEQWMTVPEFSAWLHDILNQNQWNQISKMLVDLPLISEMASGIKARMDIQGICRIATLISPGCVNDAKCSCSDASVRNFFTVSNDFHTMLQVISADEDVPHQEAVEEIMELMTNGSPIIITGNGGQGKTSLMMRIAVQWVSMGQLAVWMSLSNKETLTEPEADQFFACLNETVPAGQRVMLCIDNPLEGSASFSSLRARWPQNAQIQLIMAERENRLTLLADPDRDLLLHWFDNAKIIVLQGINHARPYHLKDYVLRYFPESRERRKTILEKCTSYLVREGAVSQRDQLSVTSQMLNQYGKPNVSLVELIYRTLFELKKISSKPESIRLDWEEWGQLINREFQYVDSDTQLYSIIAALKIFNTPLSLSLFCRYFELNERKLRNRLCERFVPHHVEPVIYRERSGTLQPKHDVIAELFFLFHKDNITINTMILDLIAFMDEDEIEEFLTNIINKREVRKGKKYPVGRIGYWDYMESIYIRIQKGECSLSQSGRAYLCLGVLWAENQRKSYGDSPTVETVLEQTAPAMEPDLLMAKLYTEWGIWLAGKKQDLAAEEKFLDVIRYNPKQIPSRTELGRLLSKKKGRESEAEKYLKEIIAIDSQNIQSRTELGRLLSRQKGRESEAEKYLKEIIAIDLQNIPSRTELGRLLSRQKGRESEAEKYLKEAIQIDPKNLHPHTELGRLLSRQKGRESEAEKYLKEAIQIDPQNLHPRTVLAKLYEHRNRMADARQLYQEICEIAPKDRFGREGLSRLR